MFSGPEVTVLGIGIAGPSHRTEGDGLNFCQAASGRQAHELMRQRRFDLLLLSPRLPDAELWDFVRRTRVEWPWQRWALVSEDLGEQVEQTARMMGAVKVFTTPPGSEELMEIASRLRDDAAAAVRGTGG